MNARLQNLLARPELTNDHDIPMCRLLEMRVVLGCAGVGAVAGEEFEYLSELQTFTEARHRGATIGESVAQAFPQDGTGTLAVE